MSIMTERTYWVYLLASRPHGTLYIGVSNDLVRRVYEHWQEIISSFTSRYHIHRLVHFEAFSDIGEALYREKSMKRWRRDWKIALIEAQNPDWRDLYDDICR
jgi:putative endonuclease